jgi:RNA-binding protein NOB1
MAENTIFIADANFFIEGNPSIQTPPKIYTTADALSEVRDKRSQLRIQQIQLSHEIVPREPTQESYETVVRTATDSGNVVLLSPTDMRLIALALDFLPSDPPPADDAPPSFDQWITVDNFGKLEDFPVILCTSDTTMQCVAILLGIHVMSPNGQRIAEVKRWLLRCAACGAETLDASKQFCPECGQHELVRYALVTRSGVERELPLPQRFVPTPKGKKYSIPLRGGKTGKAPLILSEDMMQEAKRKYVWTGGARSRKDEQHGFFEPRRKARPAPVFGHGTANPNVPNHLLGKKKKRNRD